MNAAIERPLAELIAAVQEASSAPSLLAAVQALASGADPKAAPLLVEVLGYNNPGAAVAAVEGLIALGPAAVPALLQLDPENYGARAWAIRALAGIGDVRGLPLLEDALGSDVAASVRRAAAKGLGQLQLTDLSGGEQQALRRRCLTALAAACSDGEWVVRYAVAVGLEALALELETDELWHQAIRSLQTLAEASHESTLVVRSRARLALERLEQP